MSDIPDILNHHDKPSCNYTCWGTEPRRVKNCTAKGCRPTSSWARTLHLVEVVGGTVLNCSCEYYEEHRDCMHVQHVLEHSPGCTEHRHLTNAAVIEELKKFARAHRSRLKSAAVAEIET